MFALVLALSMAADPLPPGAVARLGSARFRHPDRPAVLAFSPDGTTLYSGGPDGRVRAWDVATGAERGAFRVKDGSVTALAAAAGGKTLLAHFGDDKLRVLDAGTLRPLAAFPAPALDAVAVTADGSLLAAVALSEKILLRETANNLDRLELPPGRAVAISDDGSRVAASDPGSTVTVRDVLSGRPVIAVQHPNRDGVTHVAFSADAARVATADPGPTGRVRVWDAGTGEKLAEFVGEGPVAFTPAGRILCRRAGGVGVFDAAGTLVRELARGVTTFAVSADGKLCATAGAGAKIAVWNVEIGAELRPEADALGTVAGVFADGESVIIAGARGVARWDPKQPLPEILARPADAPAAAAFAGNVVVTAGGTATAWPGAKPPGRGVPKGTGTATAAAVSADGTRFAVGTDDKRITVSDATGVVIAAWDAPGVPLGLAFRPGTSHLAVVGRDGFARMWDFAKPGPAEVWKLRVPRGQRATVAASPDGRLFAIASLVRVEVLSAATGARAFAFDRKWEDGPFLCAAFSPDGRLIAGGATGSHGPVTVWEVATRSPARRFTSDAGTVAAVAFLPGGRLVAAGQDDNLIVWDITGRAGTPPPAIAEVRAAWANLLRLDASVGCAAVQTLAAAGPAGVDVVRAGIQNRGAEEAAIRKAVADLDAPAFAAREAATKQLVAAGASAGPAVDAAATATASNEVRERAEVIFKAWRKAGEIIPRDGLYGEQLRLARATWALELIGTPAAKAVAEEIAGFGRVK